MRQFLGVFLGLLLSGSALAPAAPAHLAESPEIVRAGDLPGEARQTLALIKQGGPYPYSRDGAVFSNRERRLPTAAHGTYREYTVPTPGRHDRGARRIIATRAGQFWYTADHYRTFKRIVE